jgi:phage-related protein
LETHVECGNGVNEIRIHTETGHRVIYIAKFEEAIYVLHAFVKKTPKTAKKDIDLSTRRFKELLILRKD